MIASAWAWLKVQPWAIYAAIFVVAIVGVIALVIGMRRASEKAGAAIEKLEQQKRARDAEIEMGKVPRPDRDDVDERLRDGTF